MTCLTILACTEMFILARLALLSQSLTHTCMTVVSNTCKSTPTLFGPHTHRGHSVCLHSLLPKHWGVEECIPTLFVPHVTWGSNSTPTLFGPNVIWGPKSVPLHTICFPYTWGMKCKQCKFIYTQSNMESQPRFK